MRSLLEGINKSLAYLSLPFEYRRRFFLLARLIFTDRPLTGELMRLSPHRKWLKQAGIHTVIDIGSFTGAFAFAMRQILPETQIYSYEPLPDSYQKLVRNLEKFGKFHAFQTALGNRQGELTFWRNAFTASSSALPMSELHKEAFPETIHSEAVSVPVARLDDFLERMNIPGRVLLKLDVQGYELEVLRGGLKLLESADYLILEVSFKSLYEGQPLFEDVHEFLKQYGFAYAGSLDDMASPRDGSILQADALFVRKRSVMAEENR